MFDESGISSSRTIPTHKHQDKYKNSKNKMLPCLKEDHLKWQSILMAFEVGLILVCCQSVVPSPSLKQVLVELIGTKLLAWCLKILQKAKIFVLDSCFY
jgi:hypothetical protein